MRHQPERPPAGRRFSGYTIFDLLFLGGSFALFCRFCLAGEKTAEGYYPFLRYSEAGATAIYLVFGLSLMAVLAGLAQLFLRLSTKKRPGSAAKNDSLKAPGVLSSLIDACGQLTGAKVVVETEEDKQRKAEEEAAKAEKRNFRAWLRQDKTRLALSSALVFITIFLAPKILMLQLGTHALLLYLLQFAAFVGTFVLALISWIEPT